jgi:hypothetical protein
MIGNRSFITLSLATALGVLGAASAVAGRDDMNERGERGGHVVPGSLDGVNPAYHPEIFGSAATAPLGEESGGAGDQKPAPATKALVALPCLCGH